VRPVLTPLHAALEPERPDLCVTSNGGNQKRSDSERRDRSSAGLLCECSIFVTPPHMPPTLHTECRKATPGRCLKTTRDFPADATCPAIASERRRRRSPALAPVMFGEIALMNLILSADFRRLHLPPRRGKEKVAQGKGAQRLPPWVTGPHQQLPLSTVRRASPQGGAADRGKRAIFVTSLPPTALRLSGATLVLSLRDFGLARLRSQCNHELREIYEKNLRQSACIFGR